MSKIAPDLKIKRTISHPIHYEEVIGFVGRNKTYGRKAIVIKEDGLDGETVVVPTEYAEDLMNGNDDELVVLQDDTVLEMVGPDFALEYTINTITGRGEEVKICSIPLDNNMFFTWPRSKVEINNE